ncbi:MAG: pirin family protein [Methanospirillum sp.]|uniref:pirin family protein n=1 Tax=Methanospirillum sp. TaxID=45200 RepID=UPI00236CEFAD|nr:pirin family protein [Methanospirillum sp.]MDD1728569.1 pirin family protein [Methanospirillum sp.]
MLHVISGTSISTDTRKGIIQTFLMPHDNLITHLPISLHHMAHARSIAKLFTSRETMEGAGVRLHRAFGYHTIPDFDPFLMFDDFRADRPEDYLAGFPWHPHRGIETVTYMLEGTVEHGDSMGHVGNVDAGGVQWMTAGSGIIHQEMPKPINGRMGGFQLWVNLPRAHKMMDPWYQEISAEKIPLVRLPGGIQIRVISGRIGDTAGPVNPVIADMEYLDVSLDPDSSFTHAVKPGSMAAAYVISGSGRFDQQSKDDLVNRSVVLYGQEGETIGIHAGSQGVRFLLFSGKPLREPIAWGGPIVMNTQEELEQAFSDYEHDRFIRKKS